MPTLPDVLACEPGLLPLICTQFLENTADQRVILAARATNVLLRNQISASVREWCAGWGQAPLGMCVESVLPSIFPHLELLFLARTESITGRSLAALEHLPKLKTLVLGDSPTFAAVHDESLLGVVRGGALKHLDLPNCSGLTDRLFAELAEQCSALTHLDVSGTQIGDLGLITLAYNCPDLQYLRLAECTAVSSGALTTLAMGCPQLKTLLLSGCHQLSEFSGLQQLHCLQTLCLARCTQLDDQQLESVLKSNPELSNLGVCGCWLLTNASLRSLCDHCPALTALDIGTLDVDDAIGEVAAGCPRLKVLRAENCRHLSSETVRRVIDRATELVEVDLGGCWSLDCEIVPDLAALHRRQPSCVVTADDSIFDVLCEHCPNIISAPSLRT